MTSEHLYTTMKRPKRGSGNTKRITDGVEERVIGVVDPIPPGWYRGRSRDFKRRQQEAVGGTSRQPKHVDTMDNTPTSPSAPPLHENEILRNHLMAVNERNGGVNRPVEEVSDTETDTAPTVKRFGGYHKGGGRPKGSTNKLTAGFLLKSIENYCGDKFEDLLAQGYLDSIHSGDKNLRLQYEKLFLSKVIADKVDLDVTSNGETLQTVFHFGQAELAEWKNTDTIDAVDAQVVDVSNTEPLVLDQHVEPLVQDMTDRIALARQIVEQANRDN